VSSDHFCSLLIRAALQCDSTLCLLWVYYYYFWWPIYYQWWWNKDELLLIRSTPVQKLLHHTQHCLTLKMHFGLLRFFNTSNVKWHGHQWSAYFQLNLKISLIHSSSVTDLFMCCWCNSSWRQVSSRHAKRVCGTAARRRRAVVLQRRHAGHASSVSCKCCKLRIQYSHRQMHKLFFIQKELPYDEMFNCLYKVQQQQQYLFTRMAGNHKGKLPIKAGSLQSWLLLTVLLNLTSVCKQSLCSVCDLSVTTE